jgi:hypothetical protein
MKWTLTLEKTQDNSLNTDIAGKHLKQIVKSAERNQTFGFKGRKGRISEPELISHGGTLKKRYTCKIQLEENKARSPDVAEERYEKVKDVVLKCAASKGWSLVDADNPANPYQPMQEKDELLAELGLDGDRPLERSPFCPRDIDDEVMQETFFDVYEREAHLRILNDAVQTYYVTSGEIRAHTILYGLPGGCKSSLLERLKKVYDDSLERVKIMDASTMTKAGLEKMLLEKAQDGLLPEILVFEEIEKVDNKDNLKCLGSVMASGYLQRTNARIGNVQVPVKCLVLATCNDEQTLKNFMQGYIWDRFTNQLECTLPGREVMKQILLDKIKLIPHGNPIWADKALELAAQMGVVSPRKMIGYLAGRRRLETGEYQRDIMSIHKSGEVEQERLRGLT